MAITEGNFRLQQPARPLAFTGERMTTAVDGQIEFEHFHRYCLARDLSVGRDVLDIASGEGYGAAMLAGTARSVVGVEIDPEAVEHARGAYILPNLRFEVGNASAIPLPNQSVDLTVSFETIEHLDDPSAFLREVRRVLRPDGILLVSTPDRTVYSAAGAEVNEFHRLEYTAEEFLKELDRHFVRVALFKQRPVLGSAVMPVSDGQPGAARTYERRTTSIIETSSGLARAPYLIALAGDEVLPTLGPSHYLAQHGTRWVQETMVRLGAAEQVLTEQLHHVERNLKERNRELEICGRAAEDAEGKFKQIREALEREREALTVRLNDETQSAAASEREQRKLAVALEEQRCSVTALDGERAKLGAELEEWQRTATALKEELRTARDETDRGTGREKELSWRLRVAEQGLEASGRELDARARALDDMEARFKSVRTELNQERAALAVRLHDGRRTATALEADLAAARSEAALLEQRLARSTAEGSAALASRDDDLRIWAAQAAHRDAAFAELRNRRMALEREGEDFRSELVTLRKTIATLLQDLAGVSATRDAKRDEAGAAQREMSVAKAAAEQARSQLGRLEGEVVQNVWSELRRGSSLRYRIGRALGLAPPLASASLYRNAALLNDFVGEFDPASLMAPGPEGRMDRVLRFLLGAADTLEDLPFFSATAYLEMHPQVADEGVNPLLHYVATGQHRGLNLHPLIDTKWYRARYPDCVALDITPAAHFATWGARKAYNPHPLFDTRYYLGRYPDVASRRINPLVHFLRFPGCDPHPLFSSAFYLERNPDVAAGTMNPLVHYLLRGAYEGRDPNPGFSSRDYLDRHPEVARAGINPLVHFLANGGEAAVNAAAVPAVAPPLPTGEPPRLLIVDATYPTPDRDAGSLNQVALIRIFQALGYEVHFAADLEFGLHTPYKDQLGAMGVICACYPDYLSVQDLLEREGKNFALFMLTRVHFGARHIDAARAASPEAKVIFNTVDLHYLREEREARLNDDPAALERAMETRALETALAAKADATFVVSEREEELLREAAPGGRIVMLPLFQGGFVERAGGFGTRSGIGFIGGFKHAPNRDGVAYFLDEVWPLVRRAEPAAEFFVIGADLPDSLAARRDPGVTMVGHVPELEPWFARLRLTVAPLRYGAGAKGKVVGSLAHGVPCVASPIAAEGMGLVDGTDILVGATPAAFAEHVLLLLHDEARWTELSDAGTALIRRRYSLDHGIALLRDVLTGIGMPVAP